jgi:sugar-specific transcriptional regulator TrmB
MDAQVYIRLAKRGPQKALEVGKALRTSKPQLYRSLKNLESKGIVSATLEHPAKFSALPFEKALDLLAKTKMKKALEEAQQIQENKNEILANWQALSFLEYKDTAAKFMIINGRNTIYTKIQQMIMETKNQFSTMTTAPKMIRADQFGLFDTWFNHPLKSKIKFRFLTELTKQNVPSMKKLMKEIAEAKLTFEGRTPELGLKLFPRIILRDQDEILFFINSEIETSATEQDSTCLWTNCGDLIQSFTAIFEDYWRNATDIRQTIEEMEKGKPPQKTFYIDIAETARKTYEETMHSAKEDIIMMTSSEGVVESWKAMPLIKEWAERGLSIKIMAPITNENLDAARQLSKYCEVRHVPKTYMETTIVDGRHLFQFKNPQTNPRKREATPYFDNTFYTSDLEHIRKMKKTLTDVWQSASAASVTPMNSLVLPSPTTKNPQDLPEEKEKAPKTEELFASPIVIENEKSQTPNGIDTFETLKSTKKTQARDSLREVNIARAIWGQAIIHPPTHLNIPPILIQAFRVDQSTFGETEDNMIINMLLQTPNGKAFVPVAVVQDNPTGDALHKAVFAGLPAGQNVKTVAENELEVWSKGNDFFAGWTVPVPLLPLPYTLPPSSMMLEGHGTPKHRKYTVHWPSGYTTSAENNERQAFATFVNQSWRYAGPASDGALATDVIMITTSPKEKKKEKNR